MEGPEKRRRDKSIGKLGPVDRIARKRITEPTRSSYTLTRRDRFDHRYLSFRRIHASVGHCVCHWSTTSRTIQDGITVRNQAGRSAVPSVR